MSLSAHDVGPAVISGNNAPRKSRETAGLTLSDALDQIRRLKDDLEVTRIERDLWKRKAEDLDGRIANALT